MYTYMPTHRDVDRPPGPGPAVVRGEQGAGGRAAGDRVGEGVELTEERRLGSARVDGLDREHA